MRREYSDAYISRILRESLVREGVLEEGWRDYVMAGMIGLGGMNGQAAEFNPAPIQQVRGDIRPASVSGFAECKRAVDAVWEGVSRQLGGYKGRGYEDMLAMEGIYRSGIEELESIMDGLESSGVYDRRSIAYVDNALMSLRQFRKGCVNDILGFVTKDMKREFNRCADNGDVEGMQSLLDRLREFGKKSRLDGDEDWCRIISSYEKRISQYEKVPSGKASGGGLLSAR